MNIVLSTINDVKEFVGIVTTYDCDIDLLSGRYAVDAKSIMGIFSLDLSKPLKVNIESENPAEWEPLMKALLQFAAEG